MDEDQRVANLKSNQAPRGESDLLLIPVDLIGLELIDVDLAEVRICVQQNALVTDVRKQELVLLTTTIHVCFPLLIFGLVSSAFTKVLKSFQIFEGKVISGNKSTHAQLNFKVTFHLVDKGRGSLLLKLWVLLVLQGDV